MPDSEEPKQVSSNDLRNSQFGGGFINAESVNAQRIGGDIYNIHIEKQTVASGSLAPSQQERDSLEKSRKTEYLEQLKKIFDDVSFGEFDLQEDVINQPKKLANIFVLPSLEEEASEYYQSDLLKQHQQIYQFKHENQAGRKIPVKQLFKNEKNRHILLLGTPGAGKTTLINYFILALCGQKSNFKTEIPKRTLGLALKEQKIQPEDIGLSNDEDWLPIVIRIRELACYLNMSILDFAQKYSLSLSMPDNFFEYWLEKGRAIIFLDGLDEVEKNQQLKIVELIKAFLGKYPHNRVIITSRITGNPGRYFQARDFPRYYIQPFNNKDIIVFIHRWYNSYCWNKIEAKRYKINLNKAIFGNERINILARNPLLLTIILLIHREQRQLPQERCNLYDCAIKTLLNSWDNSKRLENHKVLLYLKPDDLRRMMAKLAYWIHAQSRLDNQQGTILIKRDTLIEQLRKYIKDEKNIRDHEAKAEAERFLNQIVCDRTGLITQQGNNFYAFVHKTFQEYLAAEDIYNRFEEQQDLTFLLNEIRPYLCESHWYEVILLLVARLNANQAAQLIKSILERKSDYEEWLHRDLLFAGRCLAENPEQFQHTRENSHFAIEIFTRLVKLEASDGLCVGQKIKQQISEILLKLSGTTFAVEVLFVLKIYSQKISKERLLMYQMILGNPEKWINEIIPLLKNKQSSDQAITIIEKIVQYNKVSDFLIQELRSNFHHELGIAKALKEFGYNDEDIDNTLMQDEYEEYYENEGYENFIHLQIEEANTIIDLHINPLVKDLYVNQIEASIHELIEWLYCEDSIVCNYVAKELGKLSPTSKEVEIKLLEELKDTSKVQDYIVQALGYLKNPSDKTLNTLVFLLHNNKSIFIRTNAAQALTQLEINPDFVLQQLLNSLDNHYNYSSQDGEAHYKPSFQNSYFSSEVLKAVVNLGNKFNGVIPALAKWIKHNQDKDYVIEGIDALWILIESSTVNQS